MGEECYFPEYTRGKEKRDAYNAYFQAVLASLDAPYPYDIVAHIGYCSRNAVYADPKIRYEDFSEILDRILYRIVEKDKILEINTSSKTAGSPFLPDTDILRRYYEMGRQESFLRLGRARSVAHHGKTGYRRRRAQKDRFFLFKRSRLRENPANRNLVKDCRRQSFLI